MKRLMMLAVVVALVSGCIPPNQIIPVSAQPQAGPEHRIDRSYQIGMPASAYVGDPMVRVKDYWVSRKDRTSFALPVGVSMRAKPFGMTETFPAGTAAQLVGYTVDEGVRRRLVVLPGKDAHLFPLMIDEAGHYTGRALNMIAGGVAFSPSTGKFLTLKIDGDLTFLGSTEDEVSSEGGYLNFELVYAGSNANEINIIYREYTATDLARPAFSQNLTYGRDSPTIRFKKFRIDVQSADNENIRFVVQDDGLKAQ